MKQLIDLLKATPIERMEGNSQVRIIDVTADSRAVETGSLFFYTSFDFAIRAISPTPSNTIVGR